jgi:hypothetical protein
MFGNKSLKDISILVLPLAGLVTMLGLLMRGPLVLPSNDINGFVQAVTATNFSLTWIILFSGTFLSIYGVLTLYNAIKSQEKRWSAFALIFSIAGLLIFLPTTGIITFVGPYAAQLYLQGQTTAMQVIISALDSPLTIGFLIISAIIYTIGTVLFAVSIRKNSNISTIAGILFALHGPLVTFGAATAYAAELTGGILLFVSGLWISWNVLKK